MYLTSPARRSGASIRRVDPFRDAAVPFYRLASTAVYVPRHPQGTTERVYRQRPMRGQLLDAIEEGLEELRRDVEPERAREIRELEQLVAGLEHAVEDDE